MEKTLRRFTKRRGHKPQPSELYPQYAALFRRMDSDNSGELSLEEIRSALVKDEDFARATGAPTTLTRLAATARRRLGCGTSGARRCGRRRSRTAGRRRGYKTGI